MSAFGGKADIIAPIPYFAREWRVWGAGLGANSLKFGVKVAENFDAGTVFKTGAWPKRGPNSTTGVPPPQGLRPPRLPPGALVPQAKDNFKNFFSENFLKRRLRAWPHSSDVRDLIADTTVANVP